MPTIEETLNEREKTHGKYVEHASMTQALKRLIRANLKRAAFSQDVQDCISEALDMIAHKIGRITAGDSLESDHWRDIAGYATLVVRELEDGKNG